MDLSIDERVHGRLAPVHIARYAAPGEGAPRAAPANFGLETQRRRDQRFRTACQEIGRKAKADGRQTARKFGALGREHAGFVTRQEWLSLVEGLGLPRGLGERVFRTLLEQSTSIHEVDLGTFNGVFKPLIPAFSGPSPLFRRTRANALPGQDKDDKVSSLPGGIGHITEALRGRPGQTPYAWGKPKRDSPSLASAATTASSGRRTPRGEAAAEAPPLWAERPRCPTPRANAGSSAASSLPPRRPPQTLPKPPSMEITPTWDSSVMKMTLESGEWAEDNSKDWSGLMNVRLAEKRSRPWSSGRHSSGYAGQTRESLLERGFLEDAVRARPSSSMGLRMSRPAHQLTPKTDTPRGRCSRSPVIAYTDHTGVLRHDVCATGADAVDSVERSMTHPFF